MPYTANLSPNGTVTCSKTSNVVTGSNTKFVNNFSRGSYIANSTGVFVGYVSYVSNNNSMVLTANANVAITGSSYRAIQFYPNLVYNYNSVGNITTYGTNATVSGYNTYFIANIKTGQDLYIPNTSITTSVANIFLGRVGMIVSNTQLYLEKPSVSVVSNVNYWIVDNYDKQRSLQNNDANVSGAIHTFNKPLYDFTVSGLLSGADMVHNYHPPLQDPITGIFVHLPATIANNSAITGNLTTNYQYGQGIAGGTTGYTHLRDFESDTKVFGSDITYVHDSLHMSQQLQDLANSSAENFQQGLKNLKPFTNHDHTARLMGASIPSVADDQSTLKGYFNKSGSADVLAQTSVVNIGASQDPKLRVPAPGLKHMRSTGAPIAIPGVLNVVSDTFEPATAQFSPPVFYPSSVNIMELANLGVKGSALTNLYASISGTST
jgi:hypothetical protein